MREHLAHTAAHPVARLDARKRAAFTHCPACGTVFREDEPCPECKRLAPPPETGPRVTTMREHLAAFLSVWGVPTEAELDLWEATLRDFNDTLTELLALWLRSERRKPAPQEIVALGRGGRAAATMRAIVADCADAAGVTVEEIRSPSREARLVRPRQAAMHRMVEAGYSLTQIGRVLHRDHSTVMHGARRHAARIEGRLS